MHRWGQGVRVKLPSGGGVELLGGVTIRGALRAIAVGRISLLLLLLTRRTSVPRES